MSPEIFIEQNIYNQCLSHGIPNIFAKKYAEEGLKIYKEGYSGNAIDLVTSQLNLAKAFSEKMKNSTSKNLTIK